MAVQVRGNIVYCRTALNRFELELNCELMDLWHRSCRGAGEPELHSFRISNQNFSLQYPSGHCESTFEPQDRSPMMEDSCALNADGTLKEAHEIDFDFSPSDNTKKAPPIHNPPSTLPLAAAQPLRQTARARKQDKFQEALRFQKEPTAQPDDDGEDDDGAPSTRVKRV